MEKLIKLLTATLAKALRFKGERVVKRAEFRLDYANKIEHIETKRVARLKKLVEKAEEKRAERAAIATEKREALKVARDVKAQYDARAEEIEGTVVFTESE